jgi:hypothetical protein
MYESSKRTIAFSIMLALLAVVILLPACAEDPVETPPASPPSIPTNGLLVFYPFNGDALDASGNDYNADLLDKAKVTTFLTLADSVRARVRMPNEIFAGRGDFTISTWARLPAPRTGQQHTLISGARSNNFNALYLIFTMSTDSWDFMVEGREAKFGPSATIKDMDWHHVAVLRNGSIARFYIDGDEIGDGQSISNVATNIGLGGLLLGQEQDALGGGFEGDQRWAGDLDNLRIYNRALTESEIRTLYRETGWGE